MHTKRIGFIAAAIASVLASGVSRADLVTYSATGAITQTDNAGQLPGFLSGANVGDQISLLFTVDTGTPGIGAGPGENIYQSALISAAASFGSNSTALGIYGNQIIIAADSFDGSSYSNAWLATTDPNPDIGGSFTGDDSQFNLFTGNSDVAPQHLYADASLSNAPLTAGHANAIDELAFSFQSFVNGVAESSSDIVVGSDISIRQVSQTFSAPEIDASSTAAAFTLLMGALAIVNSRRSRRSA
jgi:hypothetical protein